MLSKIIEKNQSSLLNGNAGRPPVNFSNQDQLRRTIEANQLTVHSVHTFDLATVEPGVDFTASTHPVISIVQFLKEGTGIYAGIGIIVAFVVSGAIRILSDVWLSHLVDQHPGNYRFNLTIYACFAAAIGIIVLLRSFGFASVIFSKSMLWHKRLLEAVLSAPMSFYDATPLGHILSYFARHLFLVDENLPEAAIQVLSFIPLLIGSVLLVSIVVPWFWTTLPLYFVLIILNVRLCHSIQKKFRQLEANNKAPMFAHLSSTLEGLFSIRLYGVQDKFDSFNRTLIDSDHKALYSMLLVKMLMALCLDLISSLFIFITAVFIVLFDMTASQAGLALVSSLQLLLFLPWCFRLVFEQSSSMESVSSLIYFSDHVRKEEGKRNAFVVSEEWPKDGAIKFENVTLRYLKYGVAVLKDVSFEINPREKIAIVGRSGSGKSTILSNIHVTQWL